jgi:hypothetical protein
MREIKEWVESAQCVEQLEEIIEQLQDALSLAQNKLGMLESDNVSSGRGILHRLRFRIKKQFDLGYDGFAPNERILIPKYAQDSRHVFVDSFLYTDEEMDELVQEGRVDKFVCRDCSGVSIEERGREIIILANSTLDILSHSLDAEEVEYLFSQFLPSLERKTVVDVGSRLGVSLYGVWLCLNCG